MLKKLEDAVVMPHLAACLHRRKRYLILTDLDSHVHLLADLATKMLRLEDSPEMKAGEFQWLDGTTGFKSMVWFLTVRKTRGPLVTDVIRGFFAVKGAVCMTDPGKQIGDHGDIIPLSDNPARMYRLLSNIAKLTGKTITVHPSTN